jgi:uncharacterized protein (TIGR03382 family)
MRESLFVVTLAACGLPHVAQAGILAGPITNPANGNQYILLTQNTWAASQAEALALGGNLVTINDQAEQDWVFDVFSRAGGSGRGLWIGLSRPSAGSAFQWASGDPLSYTHWAPGEPNFAEERFVYMLPTLGGTPLAGYWNNDYDRTIAAYTGFNYSIPQFALHGVVEIVPSPSTAALLGLSALSLGRRRRR